MKRIHGFTLIELIVVIIIIGVLSSVAVPAYNSYLEQSKNKANKALEQTINSAIEMHYTEYGEYPKLGNAYPGFIAWNAQGEMWGVGSRHTLYPPDIGTLIKSLFRTIPQNAFCKADYQSTHAIAPFNVKGKTWEEIWPLEIPGGQDWPGQIMFLYDDWQVATTHPWHSHIRSGIKMFCDDLPGAKCADGAYRGGVTRVEVKKDTDPNCY